MTTKTPTTLLTLLPEMLEAFLSEPGVAVLVLTKHHCAACAVWSEQIEAIPAEPPFAGVRFAKLILDQPGLREFKRSSPWLREVTDLPYNVIYVDGQVVARFPGGGVPRLATRLARLAPPLEATPAEGPGPNLPLETDGSGPIS